MTHIKSIFLAVLFAFLATVSAAQEPAAATAPPDYKLWDNVAERAQAAIDEGTDETAVFEALRGRLASFRAEFAVARDANVARIDNLNAQITALGPVPESGEEAEDIANRRSSLQQQLQTVQAPIRVADAAFRQAEGLINEIDKIIRARETKRVLSLGPSPLNPVLWGPSLRDFGGIFRNIAQETTSIADPARQQGLRENIPLVVFLVVVGLLFIVRGRNWAGRAIARLRKRASTGSGVWQFLVSFLRILLPLIGLFALTQAVRVTGLTGVRIEEILAFIPIWGAVLLVFRWLSESLFSRFEAEALIPLKAAQRSEARFYTLLLSLVFVVRGILEVLMSFGTENTETKVVIAFPVIVVLSLIVFRLGHILRDYKDPMPMNSEHPEEQTSFSRMLKYLGSGLMLVAVVAPIMAGIGYAEAGNFLLFPAIATIAILGLLLVLHNFGTDIYILLSGQGEEGRDALIPTLIGFVLFLCATPLLALVWGARVADLLELWTTFSNGFSVGGTRISPTNFIAFAFVFAAGYTLTRLLQGTLRSNVLPKTKIDIGGQTALVSGIGYVGIFLSVIVAITMAGIDLSSLAIVAGALSVGIGFGLQNIVQNFVSGIILLIERPISKGDWIDVNGQMGYVRDISVRSTRIETFDRTDVIIPNADLVSGTVTNYTRGNTVGRLVISVGVAYGSDVRQVEEILMEIANAQPMVLNDPPPSVVFDNFGADSLEFQVRMILRDVNWTMVVKNDVNHEIYAKFKEAGIEIPFAQRDVWLRNPEALRLKED